MTDLDDPCPCDCGCGLDWERIGFIGAHNDTCEDFGDGAWLQAAEDCGITVEELEQFSRHEAIVTLEGGS